MNIRPRYSLLTLLVLTAVIAGGVKYWRGPHWRTLSEPRTVQDELLIKDYAIDPRLQDLLWGGLRCQYRNNFAGPELLMIQGQPGLQNPLMVQESYFFKRVPGDLGLHEFQTFLVVTPVPRTKAAEPQPRELIHCWYSAPTDGQYAPSGKPAAIPESTPPIAYTVRKPHVPYLYLVSDQKRVFQLHSIRTVLQVSPIQLAEIDNLELRTLIEAELARLPDVEKNP